MPITTLWRTCTLVVLGMLLSACETMSTNSFTKALNIQTGPQTLDLAPAPANATVWADPDIEHLQNRAEGYGLVHMPAMEKFLNGLLAKVRAEAGVPQWPGKVYITANSGLDAYTQKSGNIYLSLGYLQEAESEDELFALVAHEFSHSYLEYAALSSSLLKTDKAADISTNIAFVGRGGDLDRIASSNSKALETAAAIMLTYQLSRNLIAPVWTRSQEYAADEMAVQLSIRLGYSVPDGLVRVLERQLSYEKKLEEQKNQQRDVLRKTFEQARAQLGSDMLSTKPITSTQMADGVLNGFMGEFAFMGEDLTAYLMSDHPDTDKRIAHVNDLHERLIGDREWPASRSAEWSKLKKSRSAQRIFDSYRHATMASNALSFGAPDEARRFARESSRISETSAHAMPALVQWQTGEGKSAAKALQDNMKSSQHRAWRSYMIYAEQKIKEGKPREASRVLDDGFQHFKVVPNAWVEYISMQVRLKNTKKASQLAEECGKRFDGYQPACKRAADPDYQAPKGPVNFTWLERLFAR